MDTSTRAPGYDLFKLIVAIILLILAIILMLLSAPQTSTATSTLLLATPTIAPVSPTSFPLTATASPVPPPAETNTSEPSAAPIPSSTSPPSTETPVPPPSPTLTEVAQPTATPPPIPTATPIPEVTATPTPGAPVASACEAATSRSRLRVGTNAKILRRLNFRSSAGIRDNWLLTNVPGTQVKVVGGPECMPYWTGAYVWWQIQLPDGRVGWSAEGSLQGSFYFMGSQ